MRSGGARRASRHVRAVQSDRWESQQARRDGRERAHANDAVALAGATFRCEGPNCSRVPPCASLHLARRCEPDTTIEDRAAIARRLLELRIEHRDLDELIARLVAPCDADDLQVRRLKKRKLRIKDQMNQLEHALIPDQPA